jgi:proteic killer suppression protein
MDVRHSRPELDQLERDQLFTAGYSVPIVKAYRKRMQLLLAATDERDIRRLKSLHFEKLKKPRDHQHSIRLNDQWRLTMEFGGSGAASWVTIVAIEDYH